MRRVPLGRALLWTLIPSSAGAALGLAFLGMTAPIGIAGATIGFGVAALILRRTGHPTRALPGEN